LRVLGIIGPGRITYEHKKEILFQTSELERRVREVDSEFEEMCSNASRFVGDMRQKLETYLTLNNIKDKISIIPVKMMMSEYSECFVSEFNVPMHNEVDGERYPLDLTDFQRVFIHDLNEQYAIGRMTFDKAAVELRERQSSAYNALLRMTMVEEFFHQDSMGFGNIILYLENPGRDMLDRHALDLTHVLAHQLDRMSGVSRFRRPFNPSSRNVTKLHKEAERKGAAVYVVSHFSELIKPGLLRNYAAQMLQDRYAGPHSRIMVKHRVRGPVKPALFICTSEQGYVFGVKFGDFDLTADCNADCVNQLMGTHDQDDMF